MKTGAPWLSRDAPAKSGFLNGYRGAVSGR
jgi:hypothetical protein